MAMEKSHVMILLPVIILMELAAEIKILKMLNAVSAVKVITHHIYISIKNRS